MRLTLVLSLVLFGIAQYATGQAAQDRTERFDRDPGWEAQNNRPRGEPRTIVQNFGYSKTDHAGGQPGEVGGLIAPAAEPAYYAKSLAKRTFNDRLSASGTFACADGSFHVLLGFFNTDSTNEWRTPNSIALRINGRGEYFYAYLEYATSRWRAGGDSPRGFTSGQDPQTGRVQIREFKSGLAPHRWSLQYDPDANNGAGAITATIDDQSALCNLEPDHRADGAAFNRFGLLNILKSADGGGEIWIDDVMINGERDTFASDPGWDEFHNRHTYKTTNVRPWFDFGFSPTNFAGGQSAGELGGLIFRGDCRYPERMASYADRLEPLSLAKPIKASGKVCLKRGVSDSTVLFGFFHDKESMASNPSQQAGMPRNFLGIVVDGPSREGFYFAPGYRLADNSHYAGHEAGPPHIYPDGKSHDWSLAYDPDAAQGRGRITLTLDKESVRLDLAEGDRNARAAFNRFGLITTWIDGNAQEIYLDDLVYTTKP